MNTPSRGGAFIRRGRLKEGGVYLLFLIYRGAFITGFTVLRFTAPLSTVPLLQEEFLKNSEVNIKIEQCFVCPNCTTSNKTTTFGCLIDTGVACKPY